MLGSWNSRCSSGDCSYPAQWTSDNAAVQVDGVACLQNARGEIKLKPGESYTRSLLVHVQLAFDQIRQKEVTFRLGYGVHAYFGAENVCQRFHSFGAMPPP
jgi:D-lyxose ketol-isomerase